MEFMGKYFTSHQILTFHEMDFIEADATSFCYLLPMTTHTLDVSCLLVLMQRYIPKSLHCCKINNQALQEFFNRFSSIYIRTGREDINQAVLNVLSCECLKAICYPAVQLDSDHSDHQDRLRLDWSVISCPLSLSESLLFLIVCILLTPPPLSSPS
jgi:hypothetical protein